MTSNNLKGLFLAHREELQAFLTRKLRDAEVAADLTQETFLRFAEQDAGSVLNSRPFLYRIANNLAIDHVRRQARQKTSIVSHEHIAHIADDQPSQEIQADGRQRLERLRALVAELPQRTREIFVLHRIEGLTYAEVAERLAISESSVQKHLAKALLHVTQALRRQ